MENKNFLIDFIKDAHKNKQDIVIISQEGDYTYSAAGIILDYDAEFINLQKETGKKLLIKISSIIKIEEKFK